MTNSTSTLICIIFWYYILNDINLLNKFVYIYKSRVEEAGFSGGSSHKESAGNAGNK